MEKIYLSGLLPEEINECLEFKQKFRGEQIFKWIGQGATSFEQMTNLNKELRHSLEEKAIIRSSTISECLKDPDGTIKLQISLKDSLAVETVLLTDKDGRKTACVSCQAGCPMKCAFCKTGQLGFARNLEAFEIVEQFLYLEQKSGMLDNIVFMGMGEPMLNLENIRKAIKILTDKRGRNLSARRITLSTSGIIKGIYDLAENGPHIRLAVSLTTADDELRSQIMPVNITNPLNELKNAINFYATKSGRRVTLEAALLSGKNTSKESAIRMIDFAKNLDVNINLIPWNPIPELPFKEPSKTEIREFVSILEKAGLNVSLRTKRGQSIGGACGQLGKTKFQNKENNFS